MSNVLTCCKGLKVRRGRGLSRRIVCLLCGAELVIPPHGRYLADSKVADAREFAARARTAKSLDVRPSEVPSSPSSTTKR
jgi:hypothetical protein